MVRIQPRQYLISARCEWDRSSFLQYYLGRMLSWTDRITHFLLQNRRQMGFGIDRKWLPSRTGGYYLSLLLGRSGRCISAGYWRRLRRGLGYRPARILAH